MATLASRFRDAGEVCVASLADGRSLQGTAQWGFLLTFCERTAGLTAQNHLSLDTWACKRFREKFCAEQVALWTEIAVKCVSSPCTVYILVILFFNCSKKKK